jgi:hypothetical protein
VVLFAAVLVELLVVAAVLAAVALVAAVELLEVVPVLDAAAVAIAAVYWLRSCVTSELALLWNSCKLICPSPLVSMAENRELTLEPLGWLWLLPVPPVNWSRKLVISLLLMEPLPLVSISANNFSWVWEMFELLLGL